MVFEDLDEHIKSNIFCVFECGRYVGAFPHDIVTLKLSKPFTVWSFSIHLSIILLLTNGYLSYTSTPKNKVEFYSVLLTKLLLICFGFKSLVLFVYKFKIVTRLKNILLELNQVHVYFKQLSCLDVIPDRIARKQALTLFMFMLLHALLFTFRINLLTSFRIDLTLAVYLTNFVTFSTVLQCTNLLDLVKHYLNIINIELINISNNQDKQHYIHLYKSRICVLNNMLPENYLSRRKLKVLLLLHFILCDLSHKIVNNLYSVHLGIIMLSECMQLTTNMYFITVVCLQSDLVAAWKYFFYVSVFAMYNLFVLFWIVKHCSDVKSTSQCASEIVYHKLIYGETPFLNAELTHFLDRVCSHKIHLTVFELFEIEYTAIRHLLGAVISFGIIVIQLGLST